VRDTFLALFFSRGYTQSHLPSELESLVAGATHNMLQPRLFAGRIDITPLYKLLLAGFTALFANLAMANICSAQLCRQLSGLSHTEDFNTLAVSGSNNTSTPIGFAFVESGSSPNTTYSASDGFASTANTYSYGAGTQTDRALGELTGAAVQSTIGACFVNNSDHAITEFIVGYTGEQWRLGASAAPVDRLDFQFSEDAGSLTTGTWTDVNALDFTSPTNTAGAEGALNGNLAANRTVLNHVIITPSAPIQAEQTFFLRWLPTNISGANDGLAIDDFFLGTLLAHGFAGDYNNNGTVDAADYIVWRDKLNQAVTISNDITPGTVSTQDLAEWRQRFGEADPPPASGSGFSSSVPEPSTLLLAELMLVTLPGRIRRW
jgi:hypothetical protein